MPDEIFTNPRLAAVYDALEPNRRDLDAYVALADELSAHRVVDLGCGTGTLALLLADRGLEVSGVDPARASVELARVKPGADRVGWVVGDASAIPGSPADLVTMTGNAAQAIVHPAEWGQTLESVCRSLRPGGWFVVETRDTAFEAWTAWNRTDSYAVTEVPGEGSVESWVELIDVTLPLVSFRWTYVFASDGAVLASNSTLRFRERNEVAVALCEHGFVVESVREAPDRPGRELVFLARRA